jgi:hypothetical protein
MKAKMSNRRTIQEKQNRNNLLAFMEARSLKPHPWAQKAGIRSSTLYNYLAGKSASLSSDTLQRLAEAEGCTVDDVLSGEAPFKGGERDRVPIAELVGVYGRLFKMNEVEEIARPVGVPEGVAVFAARVDGDGLHPIPSGWHVFYEAEPRAPDQLVGKLAVVTVSGQSQRLVRQLQRGSTAGLYTLIAWGSGPMADVEVVEAHAVLAIAQGV